MKLEEEVSIIVPFKNDRQKVVYNLVYTYGFFLEKTLSVLHTYDINDQHYNILKTLDVYYPEQISVGEIKRLLLSKRGDLTRLLDKLSDMELIVRELDPDDRRVFLVTISSKGRQQLTEMDAKLLEQRDSKINLSEEEAKQLNNLLDQLRG